MSKNLIDYLDEADIDQMPEDSDMRLVRDLCGYPIVERLMRTMPGMSIYIPSPTSRNLDSLVQRAVRDMHRDGLSVKRIAIQIGRAEGWVYSVLRGK